MITNPRSTKATLPSTLAEFVSGVHACRGSEITSSTWKYVRFCNRNHHFTLCLLWWPHVNYSDMTVKTYTDVSSFVQFITLLETLFLYPMADNYHDILNSNNCSLTIFQQNSIPHWHLHQAVPHYTDYGYNVTMYWESSIYLFIITPDGSQTYSYTNTTQLYKN